MKQKRRKQQREKKQNKPPRVRGERRLVARLLCIAIALLTMAAACLMAWKVMVVEDDFDVTFYRVTSDKLKENMRTVQVSDMHMRFFGKENAELLQTIARLEPDFITVTGDTNTYLRAGGMEYTKALCQALVAIAPTYYALGNHELQAIVFEDQDYVTMLQEAGVILLHNKMVETTIRSNAVVLAGLTPEYQDLEEKDRRFLADFTATPGYRILLTHYPDGFAQGLEREDVDLALCGHAHGGQIRLPYLGALYAPSQGFLPKLTEGIHTFGDLSLVISRGLGNNISIPRVNNDPELVVVDMSPY